MSGWPSYVVISHCRNAYAHFHFAKRFRQKINVDFFFRDGIGTRETDTRLQNVYKEEAFSHMTKACLKDLKSRYGKGIEERLLDFCQLHQLRYVNDDWPAAILPSHGMRLQLSLTKILIRNPYPSVQTMDVCNTTPIGQLPTCFWDLEKFLNACPVFNGVALNFKKGYHAANHVTTHFFEAFEASELRHQLSFADDKAQLPRKLRVIDNCQEFVDNYHNFDQKGDYIEEMGNAVNRSNETLLSRHKPLMLKTGLEGPESSE
ncbi:hypothetical protein M513_02184 [Trichuris suis]|uniref:Uncharacterized protein n=1 Tax=Trichuris suis TaxID=68888 RepID=A0A085MI81_9BILA|nr:hypothetical protein M513_02184 [Trichuris suis]